jgi:hypothetical protein
MLRCEFKASLLFIGLLASSSLSFANVIRCEVYNLNIDCPQCFERVKSNTIQLPYIQDVALRPDRKIVLTFDEDLGSVKPGDVLQLLSGSGYRQVEILYVVRGSLIYDHGKPSIKLERTGAIWAIEDAKDPMLLGNLEKLLKFFENREDKQIVIMGPIKRATNDSITIAVNIFMRTYDLLF